MKDNNSNPSSLITHSREKSSPEKSGVPAVGWMSLFALFISLLRGNLVVKDTNQANLWLRRGWNLKEVNTEYWSTDTRGSYDSRFIYHLEPRSRILRFVTEKMDKLLLKASV